MYLVAHVYSVLAFAEFLVFLGSLLGLLVLAVRQAVRGINALIDAAINAGSRGMEPRVGNPSRLNVAVEGRVHKIPGGHNEHF